MSRTLSNPGLRRAMQSERVSAVLNAGDRWIRAHAEIADAKLDKALVMTLELYARADAQSEWVRLARATWDFGLPMEPDAESLDHHFIEYPRPAWATEVETRLSCNKHASTRTELVLS